MFTCASSSRAEAISPTSCSRTGSRLDGEADRGLGRSQSSVSRSRSARSRLSIGLQLPCSGRTAVRRRPRSHRRSTGVLLPPHVHPGSSEVSRIATAHGDRRKARGVEAAQHFPPPGVHRLKRPGGGSELLDLRDYMPGDPPKMIAWKPSARKDKLFTKEFESEVPVRCTLFVDASESTRHRKQADEDHQAGESGRGRGRSHRCRSRPRGAGSLRRDTTRRSCGRSDPAARDRHAAPAGRGSRPNHASRPVRGRQRAGATGVSDRSRIISRADAQALEHDAGADVLVAGESTIADFGGSSSSRFRCCLCAAVQSPALPVCSSDAQSRCSLLLPS